MLIRHSLRKKRLYKKRFKASTPEEFSILWDKEITKISGFKELENEREKYMAKKIKENIIGKKILVVVDYERMEGIISYLI